jgi:hypothetical protein
MAPWQGVTIQGNRRTTAGRVIFKIGKVSIVTTRRSASFLRDFAIAGPVHADSDPPLGLGHKQFGSPVSGGTPIA